jgi:diguanylate cyclase (GGDEF)-like protein
MADSASFTDLADQASGYAPYGQLVKMLLPSAGSIAIYDASGECVWCSDGYERPDMRALLERLREAGADTLAGRGSVEQTSGGVPAFVSALRGDQGRPLGSVVLELSANNARYTGSMVTSLLRPVLDCLESRMSLEHTAQNAPEPQGGDGGVDLLLSVDENDREDASALEQLLRHCVEHLGCVMGALFVPDKNLSISCAVDSEHGGSQLLDRTQKHLLAWAQLNNRPMVVNRVGGSAEVAPYKILTCPVRDPHNRVTGLVALFRAASADDFELRDVRILEFVSRKAVSILSSELDPLTGLVNRMIFERRVQATLDAGAASSHALLYVDIDKLEAINASFGFHAGDEVIQRIGDVLRRAAGANAIVSRVGGDRFGVFLPNGAATHATDVGRLILAATNQLGYMNGAESVPVSVSVGIAVASGTEERVAHLLAAAELACKRAKQQGRNRLMVHDEDNTLQLVRRRHAVASAALQDALKTNDFRLEAQPIVGLASQSGKELGREVLVRMRNQAGELLAPDKFLDAAERYELLPALDRWVFCSIVELVKTEPALLQPSGCIAVNVSGQSLASGKYASFALEQLARADLAPSAFCFELKESAAVNRLADAEQLIRELARAGSKIALDDFGYGLSSLAHLKRLPVHYLKIDGRFVRRIVDDRVAESIVSGIAKAARTLGVQTIAEHVENPALADMLRALEVDFGQGFFLGRPEPFVKPTENAAELPPQAMLRSNGA